MAGVDLMRVEVFGSGTDGNNNATRIQVRAFLRCGGARMSGADVPGQIARRQTPLESRYSVSIPSHALSQGVSRDGHGLGHGHS
jgi:hypothetical protein